MATSTQVAVIGGGPGGYAAAFLAADLGLRVTLVDPEPNPGGVCLYRGCIPSKALLHVARVLTEAQHASAWGVRFGEPQIDLDRLRAWKNDVVRRITGGLGQLSRHRSVTYLRGAARFRDATSVIVERQGGGEETLEFDHAIIATGSAPAGLPGLSLESERLLDSTSALEVPDVPATLLVVGGGYIGLELGTVYATLGSRVTIVEMMPGLLPGADRDLVNVLVKRIERICDAVLLDTKVVSMTEQSDGIRVRFAPGSHDGHEEPRRREGRNHEDAKETKTRRHEPRRPEGHEGTGGGSRQREQVFEKVLIAVGRRPNSRIPGLERTRVEVDRRGFIRVDARRRTAEPSIYAIGDVVGEPMLAHKATHEGRVAAEAIAGHKVAFEPAAIPAVVFTDPEIAWCGLTEAEAEAAGRPVTVARFPWAASGRAVTLDGTSGMTKLVLDRESGRILGVGIAGTGAGELIAEGVLAIEMGALAADLRLSIHPHPTLSETLMEAAEVFFGQSTHVYRPKRRA